MGTKGTWAEATLPQWSCHDSLYLWHQRQRKTSSPSLLQKLGITNIGPTLSVTQMPVLSSRHLSPKICSKMYVACASSAMLHGSEAGGPKEPELWQLHLNDGAMTHCICGIKDREKTSLPSLLHKLDITDIISVLHCWRLRWYGHVQWATSCINSITNFQSPSFWNKGMPWKTWSECVKMNVSNCGLAGIDPLDRDAWRASVRHSLLLPTP